MDGLSYSKILVVFFSSFFISWIGTAFLVKNAAQINIFSISDKRRKQELPIPLLGGIPIYLGIFICLLISNYFDIVALDAEFTSLLAALLASLVLGALDDKYELKPRLKFLGQNIISLFLILAYKNTETPIQQYITTNPYLVYSIQWFWIMALINSMNLIDGLDGLASGLAVISITFLSILSYQHSAHISMFNLAAIGSIIAFILWNYYPAKIYLGESGSMLLGILIFISSMGIQSGSVSFLTIFAPILAMGVPALDTAIAIYRRSFRRTSFSTADRDHLHHRLLRLGINHQSVVNIFWGITVYLCLLSYSLFHKNEISILNAVLSLTGIVMIVFLVVLVERKLYTYLKNFGDQMLQVMDTQNYGSVTTFIRMVNLSEQGTPFTAYRLNLENCIQALLISSPGRILTFYTDLANFLKQSSSSTEIYFEGSTKLLVIYRLEIGINENFLREDFINLLKKFEQEKSIDLYLSVPSTVAQVNNNQELNLYPDKSELFGRRKSDNIFKNKIG